MFIFCGFLESILTLAENRRIKEAKKEALAKGELYQMGGGG